MTQSTREADVFILGIGECGSNLVASYIQQNRKKTGHTRIREYLIMNTDKTDLVKTKTEYSIPNKNTLLYSDEEIGVGGKFTEGFELVTKHENLIIHQLKELGYEGVSGFIIFTSLGGGTGCGGTPALIRLLHKQFEDRRIFIYVFGVLPFENQSSEAINSIWSLSTLLRDQLESKKGPNLIFLLSNKTMLKRVMEWKEGRSGGLLDQSLGIDSTKLRTDEEKGELQKEKELDFTQLVNPLALQTIEAILSPSIQEPGKKVIPTTDLADYSRRLDPVVVPCYFEDMIFLPEYGPIEKQMKTAVKYAVNHCSLTEIEAKPNAGSVYSIITGESSMAKLEHSAYLKRILLPYLVKGGSIQPSFVSYDDKRKATSILLLFGLPRIPELKEVFTDAANLIAYHDDSKSTIKQGWFERSKGVSQSKIQLALDDIQNLFGKYMMDDSE